MVGRTPMLFTKRPAQKGAVHKIARPEKKVAIFDPLKTDGRADGNQKQKAFSYGQQVFFEIYDDFEEDSI